MVYQSRKKTQEDSADGVITRQAVGRWSVIGDRYNAVHDQVVWSGSGTFLNSDGLGADTVLVDSICDSVVHVVPSVKLKDQLAALQIQGDLQASIAAGLCQPRGHAAVLTPAMERGCATVFMQLPMKYEKLKEGANVVRDHVYAESDDIVATHVVVGVQWGVSIAAIVSCDLDTACFPDVISKVEAEATHAREMLKKVEGQPHGTQLGSKFAADRTRGIAGGGDMHEWSGAFVQAEPIATTRVPELAPCSNDDSCPGTATAEAEGDNTAGEANYTVKLEEMERQENGRQIGPKKNDQQTVPEADASAASSVSHGAGMDRVGSNSMYRVEFFVDEISKGEHRPESIEAAAAMIVHWAEQDMWTPIAFKLRPVELFTNEHEKKLKFGVSFSQRLSYTPVLAKVTATIVQALDEREQAIVILRNLVRHLESWSVVVPDACLYETSECLAKALRDQQGVQQVVAENLMAVRSWRKRGSASVALNALRQTQADFNQSPYSVESVKAFEAWFTTNIKKKIAYAQRFMFRCGEDNYIYKGRVMSPNVMAGVEELSVFFANFEQSEYFELCRELFDSVMGGAVVLVDLQVSPDEGAKYGIVNCSRVVKFRYGMPEDQNMLLSYMQQNSINYVACCAPITRDPAKPAKRGYLHITCPLSSARNGQLRCENVRREWQCIQCRQLVEYGFDSKFYCGCGSANVEFLKFLCSSEHHGDRFVEPLDLHDLQTDLEGVKPFEHVNILILGETGVGKTTWINGFANYLTHKDLDEATTAKHVCLIPTRFSVTNEKYEEVVVKVGEDTNESFAAGASSTQDPKAHTFLVDRKIVRLIDTPGIGDTRGPEMDKHNFAAILQHLSIHSDIHGICILLKPNNARLNVVFQYCINELLSQLHKSAAANIVFCFTNARSTFYRPGDTISPLTRYLAELKKASGVEIPLSPDRLYCMDNEAFRFLCCLYRNIPFSEHEHVLYATSWEQAKRESRRLLDYVAQLAPHSTRETITLNEARSKILTMAKPLSEIRKAIAGNMAIINDKIEEISRLDTKDGTFKDRLFVAKVSIRQTPLDHPRTVCTASECVDTKPVENTNANQTVFKTHCHPHCGLQNVTPDRVPNPDLQRCAAMNGCGSPCRHCSHTWDLHMHIWYDQEQVTETVTDAAVEEAIAKNQDEAEIQRMAVENLQADNEKYLEEQAVIDEVCAQFGSFLNRNAIKAYNDVIEDYLKLNITEAKRLLAAPGGSTNANHVRVELLETQLSTYQEQKRILDKRINDDVNADVGLDDICHLETKLYSLPKMGQQLMQLFNDERNGVNRNAAYNEQHFDHQSHRSVGRGRARRVEASASCASIAAGRGFSTGDRRASEPPRPGLGGYSHRSMASVHSNSTTGRTSFVDRMAGFARNIRNFVMPRRHLHDY